MGIRTFHGRNMLWGKTLLMRTYYLSETVLENKDMGVNWSPLVTNPQAVVWAETESTQTARREEKSTPLQTIGSSLTEGNLHTRLVLGSYKTSRSPHLSSKNLKSLCRGLYRGQPCTLSRSFSTTEDFVKGASLKDSHCGRGGQAYITGAGRGRMFCPEGKVSAHPGNLWESWSHSGWMCKTDLNTLNTVLTDVGSVIGFPEEGNQQVLVSQR